MKVLNGTFPGGHIKQIELDRGLKGLADGYEREVGEETGLIVPKSRLIHNYIHTWKEEKMDMNNNIKRLCIRRTLC